MLICPSLQRTALPPNRVANDAPTEGDTRYKGFFISLKNVGNSARRFFAKPREDRPMSWSQAAVGSNSFGSRLRDRILRKVRRLLHGSPKAPAMSATDLKHRDGFIEIAIDAMLKGQEDSLKKSPLISGPEPLTPVQLHRKLGEIYTSHFCKNIDSLRKKKSGAKRRAPITTLFPTAHRMAFKSALAEMISFKSYRHMMLKQTGNINRCLKTRFDECLRRQSVERAKQKVVEIADGFSVQSSADRSIAATRPEPPAPPACTDPFIRMQKLYMPVQMNATRKNAGPDKRKMDSVIVNVPATLDEEFWSMLLKEHSLKGRLPETRRLCAIQEQNRHRSNVEQLERKIQTHRYRWNGPDAEEAAHPVDRRHSV